MAQAEPMDPLTLAIVGTVALALLGWWRLVRDRYKELE